MGFTSDDVMVTRSEIPPLSFSVALWSSRKTETEISFVKYLSFIIIASAALHLNTAPLPACAFCKIMTPVNNNKWKIFLQLGLGPVCALSHPGYWRSTPVTSGKSVRFAVVFPMPTSCEPFNCVLRKSMRHCRSTLREREEAVSSEL